MPSRLRFVSICYVLMYLCAAAAIPARASVAYITNCCSNSSTVSVVDAHSRQQKALWTVGNGALDAVFSPDGAKAYISNDISRNVSVIEVSSGATLATIAMGHAVEWMALTPNGARLFVESNDTQTSSHLFVIDTKSNTVTRTIDFSSIGQLILSPDGKTLYTIGELGSQGGLLAIDTATFKVKSAAPVYIGTGYSATPDGQFIYVANFGSFSFTPNVAVISTATSQVVATIPLDNRLDPDSVQVSPDGSMVWVSEFPLYRKVEPQVVVIQTSTNQVSGQITMLHKSTPGTILFAPDGKSAYVTANGSAVDVVDVASMKAVSEIGTLGQTVGLAVSADGRTLLIPNSGTGRLAAIDASNGAPLASIAMGAMSSNNGANLQYGGDAVSPDGKRVYATNYLSDNVSVIDTASKKVIANVQTGDEPVSVLFSPDGSKAYVANSYSNSVTVIDTANLQTKNIQMPQHSYPSSLALTPDGSRLYVAGNNPQPDFGNCHCYVFAVDTSSNQVVSSVPLAYPMALVTSPDGTKVYVVAEGLDLVTISTATNTITNSLTLQGYGPEEPVTGGIVVTPDGTRAFATDGSDGAVFVVDLTTNTLVKTIAVGTNAGIVAMTPDATQVWVGDYYASSVSVIEVASATVTDSIPVGGPSYGVAFGPQ